MKVLLHVGAHPNIVSLLGAAVHQGESFIDMTEVTVEVMIQKYAGNLHVIVEFCGKGSLLHYLRSKRGDRQEPLVVKDQLSMAHQVALGMAYLASKKVIWSIQPNANDTP